MGKRDQEDKRGRKKLKKTEEVVDKKTEKLEDEIFKKPPAKTGGTFLLPKPVRKKSNEVSCVKETKILMNDEIECVEVEVKSEKCIESTAVSMSVTSPRELSKTSPSKSTPSRKHTQKHSPTNVSPPSPIASLNVINKRVGKRQRRDSGTSSEEERWLNAIESGKLDDVDDELKKMKDPKLMTARQRAMYERTLEKESDAAPNADFHMSLPTGYREKEKPQTAEEIQKAALKSQKRKQLADEKREKDKKRTMDRLLKKQENTKQRANARRKAAAATKATTPMIRYRSTPKGSRILIPLGYEFPLQAKVATKPPKRQLCGIVGCKNPKIYNCSKTNIPLCSFACYRKNVQAVRQIMC